MSQQAGMLYGLQRKIKCVHQQRLCRPEKSVFSASKGDDK